jgi:hypothetical protein
MKEIGILMKAAMVRAILREESPKIVTRRGYRLDEINANPDDWAVASWTLDDLLPKGAGQRFAVTFHNKKTDKLKTIVCPYGVEGDRLWVKETWAEYTFNGPILFRADEDHAGQFPIQRDGQRVWVNGPDRWRSSLLMPKRFSRIWLTRTRIRPPERLQAITEEDAIGEGVTFTDFGFDRWGNKLPGWTMEPPPPSSEVCLGTARYAFANFYQKIHGPKEWDRNPWVWPVDFRRTIPITQGDLHG